MKEKKQKRMFVVCVVLVILMTALAGCKKQESISRENESNENETMERDTAERETAVKETGTGSLENLREAPLLYLIYVKDGNARKLELKSGSFNWMYDNGDGTKQGSIADAPHPLDLIGKVPEIQWETGILTVELQFQAEPKEYSVSRWPVEYAGMALEHDGDCENVSSGNYRIDLTEGGYIYNIHGEWEQGYADYNFVITEGD